MIDCWLDRIPTPMSYHLQAHLCVALLFLAGCGSSADRDSTFNDISSTPEEGSDQVPDAPSEGATSGSGGAVPVPGATGGTSTGTGGVVGTGGASVGTGGSTGVPEGTGGSSSAAGGSTRVDSVCSAPVQRTTQPFGCQLAWGANGNDGNRSEYLNFITTWIGYEHFQDRSGDCDGCALVSRLAGTNVQAVYYAYFAGYALDDCNVNPEGPNLCTHGAQWLRDNRELYLSLYADYAAKTYAADPNKGVAWLLEGDFVQYTYEEQQNAFSMQELGQLAQEIICTIKANAPNALVGMNHSTWISNELTDEFWGAMPTEIMDFVWTTGVGNNAGYMNSDTNSGTYNATSSRYDYLHNLTGLGVLVDTSFGLSQMSDSWSGENLETLNQRIGEGVVAVNVTEPPADYQARLGVFGGLASTCD